VRRAEAQPALTGSQRAAAINRVVMICGFSAANLFAAYERH
jgi:hypothetical protein